MYQKKKYNHKICMYPIFNSQVCVIVYVNFCHGNSAFLFGDSLLQPGPKDLAGAAPSNEKNKTRAFRCSVYKQYINRQI